jgi:nucleoside-diphosphate-sugar epimerase/choline dehydrogenase-like flavoprotein
MDEIIIVGSGAAATAAALELVRQGLRPVILDVGYTNPESGVRVEENLYDYRRRQDSFDLHIGSSYSGLGSILSGEAGIAKLNAPNMAFVTRDAARLGPLEQENFHAVQSFALGGLGNAWGAGLYRWVDADLRNFPIDLADLEPYFNALTQEAGISGADDDLTPFFGSPGGLLPPLALSHNANRVYSAYRRRREGLRDRGLTLGAPRAAVLSTPKDGRPACDYSNLEFWQSQPYVYTPAVTLKRLIAAGQVDYRPGLLVRGWTENESGVAVHAIELATGQEIEVPASAVLVAAGAINTARLALQSRQDTRSKLPLLENPILQIPLVLPASIGRRLDAHAFGLVQLNLVWESPGDRSLLQGSLIELTAPMRAEFFGRFPLSARANLALMRSMLPAMLMLQLYYPAWTQPPAWLSLRPDGDLRIEAQPHQLDLGQVGELLRLLRPLGLWTHPALIQQPPTGHAVHYAGTLPMQTAPGPYQCDPTGRLYGTHRVYIADSASFTTLSAKNMSLGMMANAMRIAAGAARGRHGEHPLQDMLRPGRTSPEPQNSRAPIYPSQGPKITVLITGANGFIARNLAKTLRQAGVRVVGTSRTARPVAGFDRVYQATLGDSLRSALDAEPIDAVVHGALYSGQNAYTVNVDGTTRWLEEVEAAGVPLQIFLSTLSAEPDALSDYGRAKYELEQRFTAAQQIVVRLGVVVGDGGMYARIRSSAMRLPVTPLLDGGRQLLYVLGIDTLCYALRDALLAQGAALRGEAWNLIQPQPVTLREMVEAINRRTLLLPVPAKPVLAALRVAESVPLLHLPVTSTNVRGLIQQGQRRFPSDLARFGYSEQSLSALIAAVEKPSR